MYVYGVVVLNLQFHNEDHFLLSIVKCIIQLEESSMLEWFHNVHLALYIFSVLLPICDHKFCGKFTSSWLFAAPINYSKLSPEKLNWNVLFILGQYYLPNSSPKLYSDFGSLFFTTTFRGSKGLSSSATSVSRQVMIFQLPPNIIYMFGTK